MVQVMTLPRDGQWMSDAGTAFGSGSANGGSSPSREDAEAVFEAMQAKLDQLVKLPIIRNDALARSLLDDMARDVTPDALAALLEKLDARIRALLAQKGRSAPSTSTQKERPRRTLLRL